MNNRIITAFGVIFGLLIITTFTACDIFDDIIDDDDPVIEELGTVLWTYDDFDVYPEATDPVSITSPAIGSDGTIYVATYDRVGATWQNAKVHAINSDSTFKWASPELAGPYPYDPVVGTDGTIYVIVSTTIYALNPVDGSINWSYQPPIDENEQHDIGWLTLGNDGQIFFAHIASGAYTRKLYALNSDGQVMWKNRVEWGANNLAVGVDGTLFAYWQNSGDIPTFSAFNPDNGGVKWTKVLESYVRGIAISSDGGIVLSLSYPVYQLVKLDPTSGEFIWQVESSEGYPSISPDGSIFMMNSDLYCYNSSDGALKWQTGPYTTSSGSTIAIDSDGNSYGSITDHGGGNFQVFDADGVVKWEKPQGMTSMHSPAIGTNNVIYVTIASVPKGTIYALQGDKPLASSGWPRSTGGNRNSRNVNLH